MANRRWGVRLSAGSRGIFGGHTKAWANPSSQPRQPCGQSRLVRYGYTPTPRTRSVGARWNIKYGADVIKFTATAGVLSEEEAVGAPQFSAEEMKAIVEEASMWGRKVAAHAHGAEGIKRAVRAGVASIEHGSLIDDEGIRLMKERGTYLVADIYNDDYIIAEYTRLGYPQKIIEKERMVGRQQRENF